MKTYKILCNCKHEFQDKEHGKNVRVSTPTTKSKLADKITVRCTVCGKEYEVNK